MKIAIRFPIPMIATPDAYVLRLMTCVPRCEQLLARPLFRDLHRGGVRDRVAVDGLIDGLPRVSVGIDVDVNGGRRQFPAIGCDSGNIDEPLLAFAGPEAVAERAVG